MDGLKNIINQYTVEDLEKLKVLLSIMSSAAPLEVVTLRVFAQEYKEIVKHNRSVSYYHSVNTALNYLMEYFGQQKPITSIALKDVESFLIYLQQKVKKGYVVYYRNLKAAFNKALDWKYVRENYFAKVRLPKRQKVHPVFITEIELKKINGYVKNDIVRDFVTIAFYTGMRLNEVVNLTWKNVDLGGRIITVGDEDFETKGKNQRYIPICEEALAALTNLLPKPPFVIPLDKSGRNCTYVFTKTNGKKYTGDYFSRRFKRACKAAGMDKGIHFHTLRHSFASNLAQKSVSLYTIKELLGHSSISTTEIYAHLNMDSLKEAIKKLDVGR